MESLKNFAFDSFWLLFFKKNNNREINEQQSEDFLPGGIIHNYLSFSIILLLNDLMNIQAIAVQPHNRLSL